MKDQTKKTQTLNDRLFEQVKHLTSPLRAHLPIMTSLEVDFGGVRLDHDRMQLPGQDPGSLEIGEPMITRLDGHDCVQAVVTWPWQLVTRKPCRLSDGDGPGSVPGIYDARIGNYGVECSEEEAASCMMEVAQVGRYRMILRAHEVGGETVVREVGPVVLD